MALSLHGEEVYKYLIYLNDAYKRAIIDSQGQEESYWDVENSLNTLLWNGRDVLSVGSMVCRQQNSHGG